MLVALFLSFLFFSNMNIMTTNDQVDHLVNDTIEEQVVLVDMKMAAYKNQIHCVQRPLKQCAKFVALSYRWGQVPEARVDTQLGYVAKITSFDLASFYLLCCSMATEHHLKDMEYVWVDAICMDQQDPVKQSAAIDQMSRIYEQATFIVAVPDLHLFCSSSDARPPRNHDMIQTHRDYIYHLVHGQQAKMAIKDEWFLNSLKIDDPHLRYLLTNYTDHFAKGLMHCKQQHRSDYALAHLFEAKEVFNCRLSTQSRRRRTPHLYKKLIHWITGTTEDPEARRFAVAHQCHTPKACPFSPHYRRKAPDTGHPHRDEQQAILERSRQLRQSVDFLVDLVREWSAHAWLASEYGIAKRKTQLQKMKYWFIQLSMTRIGLAANDDAGPPDDHRLPLSSPFRPSDADEDDLCFFEFGFNTTDDALLYWHSKITALPPNT